jgi:hypothetical protein
MKDGHHYDVLISLAEINAVRKSACDSFACAAIQNGELLRVAGNSVQQAFYFREEFKSKTDAFLFVPITRFVKLASCLMPKNNLAH